MSVAVWASDADMGYDITMLPSEYSIMKYYMDRNHVCDCGHDVASPACRETGAGNECGDHAATCATAYFFDLED
jgi:hypothetical protein